MKKSKDGWVKLSKVNKFHGWDLEVMEENGEVVVKTDDGALIFTVEEVEVLYHFAQIVKINQK